MSASSKNQVVEIILILAGPSSSSVVSLFVGYPVPAPGVVKAILTAAIAALPDRLDLVEWTQLTSLRVPALCVAVRAGRSVAGPGSREDCAQALADTDTS